MVLAIPDRFWTAYNNGVTELKVLFDSMETLFTQFIVVFKLDETVSNTLFADQNEMLVLFKQNKMLTQDDDTVLSELVLV